MEMEMATHSRILAWGGVRMSLEQRSLTGCSPRGCKEWMTGAGWALGTGLTLEPPLNSPKAALSLFDWSPGPQRGKGEVGRMSQDSCLGIPGGC